MGDLCLVGYRIFVANRQRFLTIRVSTGRTPFDIRVPIAFYRKDCIHMRTFAAGVVVVSVMMFISGCSRGPKIDASSEESLEKSSQAILDSLPTEEKKDEFMTAMQNIGAEAMFTPGSMEDSVKKQKEMIDGKNADEIIALGKQLQAKHKAEVDKMMNGN
jgi:Family of unknown function (DUF6694)